MKSWFDSFELTLKNGEATEDLIGAGKASAKQAMGHYRFQHQAKVRDAIEETFPVLLKFLGEEWNGIWNSFWQQNETSPRSLDFFPEVFLNYFLHSEASLHLKELARFEHDLDIFPWTHGSLPAVEANSLSKDSRIVLGPYEIKYYEANVIELYADNKTEKINKQHLVLWMKGDTVHFRPMKSWEIEILNKLPEGVENAIESAPEDSEEVSAFFIWLGSSHLIRSSFEDV